MNAHLLKKISVLFILIFLIGTNSFSQAIAHRFKVVYKGENIGFLGVTKILEKDKIDFTYDLDITSSVLFKKVRVQYEMDATYLKGILEHYHLIYKVNNKISDEVKTKWVSDHYKIDSAKKKGRDRYDHKINYTTVLLFFQEPGKRSKVWGELNCRYQDLTKVGAHAYSMDTGGGRSNVFYYENNKLLRATFDTIVMDFEIVRA